MDAVRAEHLHDVPTGTRLVHAVQRVAYRVWIALDVVPGLAAFVAFVFPLAVIVAVWGALAAVSLYPDYLFPSPGQVAVKGWELLANGDIVRHSGASMFRLGLGFVVGLVLALPLGILIGVNRTASAFFMPPITFFQAIPGLAWVPLAILWLGIGHKAVTFIIFNSVFFPILFNTILGIRSIPDNMVNAALTLGASPWVLVKHVYLPGALPSIVAGMRLGAGYGWRALIGGEMIATSTGLGFMIFDARQFLGTDVVILGMIVIGILWLVTDVLILRPLERRTVLRWGTVRE
ncbi:MAG: ABC transporter permease [Candidatus Rokubacteria bacterium]|nr:ABC transporter permease [Candidatus Rokubacteria bacterium]